jgi:acyl-coenzyme A thioesterase PaaI-like protein
MHEPSGTSPDPLFDAAAALRHLVDLFCDREISPELLGRITATAEELSAEVAEEPQWDRQALLEESIRDPYRRDGRRGGFYYRGVAGPANPAAMPLELRVVDGVLITEVTLGPMHSGAPGRGHGGVLAGIFDEFAGSAPRFLTDSMAATGRLTIHYRAPIPLGVPLQLRAWVNDHEGRKIHVRGDARRDDDVIAEVEWLFIQIDYAVIDTSGAARH